jgi:hypothetical protein
LANEKDTCDPHKAGEAIPYRKCLSVHFVKKRHP